MTLPIAFLSNNLVMIRGKDMSTPYHKLYRITSFMARPPLLCAMLLRLMARDVPDYVATDPTL
jgi:hypothetical protein